jgi:hypothetical protein
MKRLKPVMKILAVTAVLALALTAAAEAAAKRKKPKATSGYPYSIMNDEPGMRSASQPEPWLANRHRSPLTPLGRAPKVDTVRPLGQAASPPMIVPGVSSNIGPAVTPPRPAGQSFQDRAVNCVHAGGASGVGAGQIGAYTRSCVN